MSSEMQMKRDKPNLEEVKRWRQVKTIIEVLPESKKDFVKDWYNWCMYLCQSTQQRNNLNYLSSLVKIISVDFL